jgi:hypothetical protein
VNIDIMSKLNPAEMTSSDGENSEWPRNGRH